MIVRKVSENPNGAYEIIKKQAVFNEGFEKPVKVK